MRHVSLLLLAIRRHFVSTTPGISGNLTSVDISSLKLPDLFCLVEEVKATKTPRILKRDREPVAMLMPVGATIQRSRPHKRSIWIHYHPMRVKVALRHSAGALQGVDRKELLRDLAEQRGQESTGRLF